MRNAADHIDAHVERLVKRRDDAGAAQIAILRKGNELEIDIGLHPLAHLQQRLDGQ